MTPYKFATCFIFTKKTLIVRNFIFLIPAFLSITIIITSCKKQPVDQLSLLPAATQTGANTFGCLVNGKAFLPKKSFSVIARTDLSCFYSNTENGYVFNIGASRDLGSGSSDVVGIATDSLKISEGETINLTKAFTPTLAFGDYAINVSSYTTNASATGELTITHLDMIKQIVSGTFQFNAVSKSGDTVKITNGRFDVHYKP